MLFTGIFAWDAVGGIRDGSYRVFCAMYLFYIYMFCLASLKNSVSLEGLPRLNKK